MSNETNDSIIDKCKQSITVLYEKYKNNEYMLQRLHNHVVNYLPNTLDYELKNHEKRIDRNNFLTNEQQTFIQVFLQKNLYYYLSSINLFYEYNGTSYMIVKEDDIIHKLLSSISKDRVLLDWKQKTKINILKQIKERSLFTSIPESDTIQNVLNMLYPTFFKSKKYAKYFLTIIGDNILKKNSHIIFLVSNKMKKLLNELDGISSISIGINNITSNFMTKYHENHSYENCRLLKINDHVSRNIWHDILKKIGLDLLCVAVHYSKRYDNSDNLIENIMDDEMKTYTNYIRYKTSKEIVDDFCNKYIQEDINDNNTILNVEWKNLHFVWKQFLSDNQYPNMIYSHNLKNLMISKYKFDEEADTFYGITSKFIPIQREFINFWENTIHIKLNDNDEFDNELEIDEIGGLFKIWVKNNNECKISSGNISEETILQIIKHFFSSVQIVEDKYFLNIICTLWNKTNDIYMSFEYIKEKLQNYHLEIISFDDVYNYYYEFCRLNTKKMVVSKRYFEKYLYYKFVNCIVYDKFIEVKCILNEWT
jgi:hypothetical protein